MTGAAERMKLSIEIMVAIGEFIEIERRESLPRR